MYRFRWILSIALGFSNTGLAETIINSDDWFQIDTIIFEYTKTNTGEQLVSIEEKSYPKDVITIEENLARSIEDSGTKTKDKLRSIEKVDSNPNQAIAFELESESARRFNIEVIDAVIKKSSKNQPEDTHEKTSSPSEDDFRQRMVRELVFQLDSSADGQLAFKDLSHLSELKDIKEKIERSAEMRVLDYKSWIQPIGVDPTSIMIQGAAKGEGAHEIEGFINLYQKRYLHVVTNLWYTKLPKKNGPDTAFSSTLTETFENETPTREASNSFSLKTFAMKQNRKLRTNELHYLDHPLFGLILKITRFEKGTEEN
ncbi:peptidoglycan binding protein CsiV [Gammaproteobacteria bacterium]|nr:peptidoglycan binding protein CsiV [Gammaproteobacteria bacterium]